MTSRGRTEKPPGAWVPDQVVDMLHRAAWAAGDFYILCPDNEVTREIDNRRILWAAEDITENRPAAVALAPGLRRGFRAVPGGSINATTGRKALTPIGVRAGHWHRARRLSRS